MSAEGVVAVMADPTGVLSELSATILACGHVVHRNVLNSRPRKFYSREAASCLR